MGEMHVAAERSIEAPAALVYDCLADYEKHQQILPAVFTDFRIEEGGRGAGTVISFNVSADGRKRFLRMRVAEPSAMVLTESDTDSPMVTTFTVIQTSPASSLVRIETRWQSAGGVAGFLESLFAPFVMRRLYREELSLLDAFARKAAANV